MRKSPSEGQSASFQIRSQNHLIARFAIETRIHRPICGFVPHTIVLAEAAIPRRANMHTNAVGK